MKTKLTMNKDAIRIICFGDRHVKANRMLLGPYNKGHQRIVDIAKEYNCHAAVDTGDSRVDSNSSPDANESEMQYLIRPLAEAGIAFWTIDGNHDRRGAAQGEITANSWIKHLKDDDLWNKIIYFKTPELVLKKINGITIQILGLPYPPRHSFASGKDLKTKKEMDEASSLYLQDQLKALSKAISPDHPLLIIFHGTVDSPRLQVAGEARMPAGHDVNLPINAFMYSFTTQGHAVACGHIHKYQILEESPLVFYTGPLIPQEFDHEGMETGVVILEFYQGQVTSEFVPIHTVEYKTVTVDLADPTHVGFLPHEAIANETMAQIHHPERTMVKVLIKAKEAQILDKAQIREALESVGIIEPRIVIEIPESVKVLEMEKQIHEEIGSNISANLVAYLKEHPEAGEALTAAGATDQDLIDAAAAIEKEAFNE